MIYKKIAAGGTFDQLHGGHKAFLLWLFSNGENVLLGITSDKFTQQNKPDVIQLFEERKNNVEDFLRTNKLLERVQIVSIDDIFGPLVEKDVDVQAIGVTNDTHNNAIKINGIRQKKHLKVLSIVSYPLVKKNGKTISSSSIRSGKMGTKGINWVKEDWEKNDFILPENLREILRQPLGPMVESLDDIIDFSNIISVGDVTTKNLRENNISPQISIVDFTVERRRLYQNITQLGFKHNITQFNLQNPPGSVVASSWSTIEQALQNNTSSVIKVKGEEDLLVIPCILLAPLSYHIFYGQPHTGMVDLEVTLKLKEHIYHLMEQFIRVEL